MVAEMAICLPLLVWLTFAIIEYGIIINTTITLSQLTRDTARYVAIHGGESTADTAAPPATGASTASILAFLKNECAGTSINYSDLTVVVGTMDPATGIVSANLAPARIQGSVTTVQISYPMAKKMSVSSKLVPGLSAFTDPLKPYTKKSTIIMENAPN